MFLILNLYFSAALPESLSNDSTANRKFPPYLIFLRPTIRTTEKNTYEVSSTTTTTTTESTTTTTTDTKCDCQVYIDLIRIMLSSSNNLAVEPIGWTNDNKPESQVKRELKKKQEELKRKLEKVEIVGPY